jgi:hypothetical protein
MAGEFSNSAPSVARPAVFSANGAAHTSPGHRPGYASPFHQALKGRNNRCLAPSGLGMFLTIEPRALPWAGISRPFGAAEGGLPSIPRGECGGGGDGARQRHDRDRQRAARGGGHPLGRASTRRQAGGSSCGRGLAHTGQRQKFLHALLCRARGAASSDAEPDAGGADGPQRPRRPAFRPVPTLR